MSVYDVLTKIKRGGLNGHAERMLHNVPDATVVNRMEFILARCKDKTVLDLGCAGTAGDFAQFNRITSVASRAYGIDIKPSRNTLVLDLDDVSCQHLLCDDAPIELVVIGEILEHLRNPGHLLDRILRAWPNTEVLVTVPNCFSLQAIKWQEKGTEQVADDHVAWYSWHTAKRLLEKSGYRIDEWHWYNGPPRFSEGLVFLCTKGDEHGASDES